DEIIFNIGRVISLDVASLILLEDNILRSVRSSGISSEHVSIEGSGILLSQSGIFETIAVTRQPYLIQDILNSESVSYALQQPGIRSYVIIPLINVGEVIGFISIGSVEPAYFSQESVYRLTLFAEQATVAIQNARLYQQSSEIAVWQERQRLAHELHD